MKIPYNRLHVHEGILFAARGGKIHSFSLSDGRHISTWQHPDVEAIANAVKANVEAEADAQVEDVLPADQVNEEAQDPDEPPAKKQKLASGDSTAAQPDESKQDDSNGKRPGKKSKNKGKRGEKKAWTSHVPDRPVIALLTGTSDGQCLVAVTSHDKNIWVFDHDGKGTLSAFSQRTMPKRPSAVVIGPDSQIISADKFGDVYSLPLRGTVSSEPRPVTTQSIEKPSKPAASALTVHSKRNLQALSHQEKIMELASQSKGKPPAKNEEPNFELTLLLGHVSMLTALALAEADGRRYIITGDRDEHIRMSRYLPQAYVIEGYCLGHKHFVSDMTIPVGRGDLLVSGGGDDDLHLWDWKGSRLLSKTSILSLAKELAPETSKLAVSGLYSLSYPAETSTQCYILAICEGINALFSWQLTDENVLNRPGIIQLPGKPLHIAVANVDGAPPKIIAAIDPGEEGQAKSLHLFTLLQNEGRLAVDKDATVHDSELEAAEMDVTEAEVRTLFHTTESLRKYSAEADDGEEDAEAAEAEMQEEDDTGALNE